MITREQLEEAFGDDRQAFTVNTIDHDATVIALLRERIPYEVCHSVIGGAEHDVLYLVDVEKALPYLTTSDLAVLADCNCWVDEDADCIALFV